MARYRVNLAEAGSKIDELKSIFGDRVDISEKIIQDLRQQLISGNVDVNNPAIREIESKAFDELISKLQGLIILSGGTPDQITSVISNLITERIEDSPASGTVVERSVFFTRFVEYVRNLPGVREKLGEEFVYLQRPDGSEIVDFENLSEADSRLVLKQTELLIFALLDHDQFDNHAASDMPQKGYDFVNDPLVIMTSESGGEIRLPFNELLNNLPRFIQPFFEIQKMRLIGFSIWYDRAAEIGKFTAEGKAAYSNVINHSQGKGGGGGMGGIDIGSLESKALSHELQELTGQERYESWVIGDMIALGRKTIQDIVRGTIEFTDDSTGTKYSPDNQYPLSTGQQSQGGAMYRAVERVLTQAYCDRTRKKPEDLSQSEKWEISFARKNAFVYYRISHEEISADIVARDNEYSRGCNLRTWLKDPNSSESNYLFRPDLKILFERLGLSMDESLYVTIVLPEDAVESMTFSDYYQYLQKKYGNKFGKYPYPKEVSRFFGMFPPSCFERDGSMIVSEMEKHAKIYVIKPEYRTFASVQSDPLLMHYSLIRHNANRNELQLHLSFEERWMSQVDSEYVKWETSTASPHAKYSKFVGFLDQWFNKLGQMKGDKVEDVFKKIENKGIDLPTVRVRGLHIEAKKQREKIRQFLSYINEGMGGQGSMKEGEINPLALKIDEDYSTFVATLDIEMDEILKFGIRDYVQYLIKYFTTETDLLTGNWYEPNSPKEKAMKKVTSYAVLRKLFRDNYDSEGIVGKRESQGNPFPGQFAESEGKLLYAMSLSDADKDKKERLKFHAEIQKRMHSLWIAYVLYLNQYRYQEISRTPNEKIRLMAPLKPRTLAETEPLTFERREAIYRLFLTFQKELFEDTIEKYSFTPLPNERFPYTFGREEMRNEMIRQGIIGSPQQAIVDVRAFKKMLAKLPTIDDVERKADEK